MFNVNRPSNFVAFISLLMGHGALLASRMPDDDRTKIVIHSGRQSPIVVNIAIGQQHEGFGFQSSQPHFTGQPVFLPGFQSVISQIPGCEDRLVPQVSVSIAAQSPSVVQALSPFDELVKASFLESPASKRQPQLETYTPSLSGLKEAWLPSFQEEKRATSQALLPDPRIEPSEGTSSGPRHRTSQKSVYLPSISMLELGVSAGCLDSLEGYTKNTNRWEDLFAKIPLVKISAYDLCAAAESFYGLSRHLEEGSAKFLDAYLRIYQCYAEALKKEPSLSGDVKKKLATASLTLAQYLKKPQEKLFYAHKSLETLTSLESDADYVKTESFYLEKASAHLLCASIVEEHLLKSDHMDQFVEAMDGNLKCSSEKTAKAYAGYAQAMLRAARQAPAHKKVRIYKIAAGFCDKAYGAQTAIHDALTREMKRDLAVLDMKVSEYEAGEAKKQRLQRAYAFFKIDVTEPHPDTYLSFEAISIIASYYASLLDDEAQRHYYLKKASQNSQASFLLQDNRDPEVYLRGARIQFDYASICPEEEKRDVYHKSALWFDKAQEALQNLMPVSYRDTGKAYVEVLKRSQGNPDQQLHCAARASAKYKAAFEGFSSRNTGINEADLLDAGFANMTAFVLSQDVNYKDYYAQEALKVYGTFFTGNTQLSHTALLDVGSAYIEIGFYKSCQNKIFVGVSQLEKLYQTHPESLIHFYGIVQKATRYLADNSIPEQKAHFYQNHGLWCDHAVNAGIEPISCSGIESYVRAGDCSRDPGQKRAYYTRALERASAALFREQPPTSYFYCVIADIKKRLAESYPFYSKPFYKGYLEAFDAYQHALRLNKGLTNNFYQDLALVQAVLESKGQ
ncbi:MAG: hypothetical protein ACK5TR_06350 [Alphaproteobacteria bacterium]|jgi:hypothetical protein